MKAKAPGKVVISGAYAVLDGARALVSAVDRYVVADSAREPSFVTPEVEAALGPEQRAPWFDSGALREGGQKLGLGSSAAIVVASLGALELDARPALDSRALAARVFPRALAAHRAAQGGGSGIDVAASAYGGNLLARRAENTLELEAVALPPGVVVRVLAARHPASTPELIRSVHGLRARDASLYRLLMTRQADASEQTARAILAADPEAFLLGLREQAQALTALGAAAGAAIVTPEVARLVAAAERLGAAALPAGAGGGDIALWVSVGVVAPPEDDALRPIPLELGASGLCCVPG